MKYELQEISDSHGDGESGNMSKKDRGCYVNTATGNMSYQGPLLGRFKSNTEKQHFLFLSQGV